MKGLNGVAAAEEIGYESPSTILQTTSLYDAQPIVPRLQDAGVSGFVSKSRIGVDLIPAIDAVLKGRTWFRT
jgi:DNA-binding NarL/FixJ family response regulator